MADKEQKSVKIDLEDHKILSHHLIDHDYPTMASALSKAIELLIAFDNKDNKRKLKT